MARIAFATSNSHKFAEAKSILKGYGVNIDPLNSNIDEIRSESCRKVAESAARRAFAIAKKPVFVEDSGLFIEALGGFPGAFSAWAFGKIGNAGILRLMGGARNSRAEFVSAIAYCDADGVRIFEGKCEGKIAPRQAGKAGFGYDPIFAPAGSKKTFAQDPEKKKALSHRRKALEKFAEYLQQKK